MKCEIEWCEETGYHRHHIISKCYGGKNTADNICYLCPTHHHEAHTKDGNIIIEGKFRTTDGYKLISHKKGEESITGQVANVYIF